MSVQQKEILQVLQADKTMTYDDLSAVLPHIPVSSLRKQVARLVDRGLVTRRDNGAFCLAVTDSAETAVTASRTARDSRDNNDAVTGFQAENRHIGEAVMLVTPSSTHTLEGRLEPTQVGVGVLAHGLTGTGVGGHVPSHNAGTGAHAVEGGLEPVRVGTTVHERERPLTEVRAYREVYDALPSDALKSLFRLATALAFVRSELSDCEAPALATCGAPGTGKSVVWKALSILLHGDSDAVSDARTLTSAQQIIGRREKRDGAYTAVPSVLLRPPDREPPRIIVLDEIGEAVSGVLQGASLLLRLEPYYYLEGIQLDANALLGFAWNKPSGKKTKWHPWQGWDGATRRMLICDLDYDADRLKRGAAKTAARRVFGSLEGSSPVNLSAYRQLAKYPSLSLLEQADDLLTTVFRDPSELPLGDPVLRGLTAAYGALFGYPSERALLAAVADVATVVGTLPNLLSPTAEKVLNARLSASGLPTVVLPKVTEQVEDKDDLLLTPAARQRIANHLASASTKGTDDLLQVLAEYKLARRVWRPIRLPRYLLEFAGRWSLALSFGLITTFYNLTCGRLKMPRVSGGVVYGVFGFAASGPRTKVKVWVDRNGQDLDSPRAYVLTLFGDDMTAYDLVATEKAVKDADGA